MDRARAIADAVPVSFWLDDPDAPAPADSLVGTVTADLVVVGGGYTGLWTALLAKEAEPGREVVVLEADRCGWGASGRNGGFCSASLTHGLDNGLARFPDELDQLERLGHRNLDGIEETVRRWSIDCHFERTGELAVATERHQVAELAELRDRAAEHGTTLDLLDADQVRAEVRSPTYLAGLWDRAGCALVNPARLAWGLRRACLEVGVTLYEHTPVNRLDHDGHDGHSRPGRNGTGPATAAPVRLRTPFGEVRADRAALGTNAYPSLLRRLRRYVVPVYDYVLMTEPLSAGQLGAIGWEHRQGLGGTGNQFLYYRLSADNRILFGGFDAVYHYGNRIDPPLEQRRQTFLLLATLFAETFPTLEDVRFTHAWAGPIDTCTRFCAFFDRSADGRVASAAGYTGLGVGASRFGAQVLVNLLSGRETELTGLELVRAKPVPFPPEPLRYTGIQLTRWSMARADRHGGRRNLWLRALDRAGLGFDS